MLRRFFAYYRPYRWLFLLDFSCAVLAGLLELGFPMAVRTFVDQLLPSGDWGLILLASAGLLGIYLLNAGLQATVTYWGHMLGINIETDMRRKSFDHLQRLSFRFYDNQKTGHLVARVTKDLEEIGEIAHHGPEDLFIAVMTFLGAFALMFAVQPATGADHRRAGPDRRLALRRVRPADDAPTGGRCSVASATSTPASRRTSAASASSRPSPTRSTSGSSSRATTPATARPSWRPIGSWPPACRSAT